MRVQWFEPGKALIERNAHFYVCSTNPFCLIEVSQDFQKDINSLQELSNNSFISNTRFFNSSQNYDNQFFLTIIPSYACNLRCTYCSQIAKNLEGSNKGTIKKATLFKSTNLAIKKMLDVSDCKAEKEIRILFYGGEPLLNFNILKDTIEFKNKMVKQYPNINFHFSIATNATLLNEEIVSVLKSEHFFLYISCDGDSHNRFRVFSNGSGSQEIVDKNIRLLEDSGLNYLFNLVITKDEVGNLFSKISNSFPQNKEICILFDKNSIISEKNSKIKKEIVKELISQIDMLIDGGFSIYENQIHFLVKNGGDIDRCAANSKKLMIDPSGGIYPCQEITSEDYKHGDIKEVERFEIDNRSIKKIGEQYNKFNNCSSCLFHSICFFPFSCSAYPVNSPNFFNSAIDISCTIGKFVMEKVIFDVLFEKGAANNEKWAYKMV